MQAVCKNLSFQISKLKRLSKFMNKELLNTIYQTSIQPCVDYACTVWGSCSIMNKDMIFRLQKRAARIVSNRYNFETDRGTTIFKDLGWQTLDERKYYFLANLMFKCIHGIAPHWLSNQVLMACEGHERITRNSMSMNVIVSRPNQLYGVTSQTL